METLAGNHLAIKVQFEIGHTSRLRSKKTPEGFTHDWEIYVQGVNKADISAFVEKVVFLLHESFPRPKRVIKDPPYVLQESGYAGFMLPIEIHFRNKEEPKRFQFSYDLDLQQIGPPHHRSEVKNFIFQHPSEEFKKKLFQGGAVVVSAIVSNSLQGAPQQMSSNINLPDGTGSSNNFVESLSGGMVSKPKMSSSDSKKHKSSRTDESNTNSFANLFGSSQNKSKQSPDTKSSGGNSVRNSNSNNITQLQHANGTSNNASHKDKSSKDKDKSSSNSAISDKSRSEKKSDRQKSSPHKEARGETKKSHESKQRSSDDSKKEKKDKVRDKDRGRDRERAEKRALSPKAVRETIGISPKRLTPQPRPSSSSSGRIEEIKKKHSENSTRSSSKDKIKSSSSSSKKSKRDKKDRDREKRDEKSQQNSVIHKEPHIVSGEVRDNNTTYLTNEAKSSSNNNNRINTSNVVKKVDIKEVKANDIIKPKSSSIINDTKLEKSSNATNDTPSSITNHNDRTENKKEKRVHKHKKKSKTKDKEKESFKDSERDREKEREKEKIKEKDKDREKEKEKEKPKDTKELMEVFKIQNNKSPKSKIISTAAIPITTATTTIPVATKSESHKKSTSKERKKEKIFNTKIEETKNNTKKKDILSTSSVKNSTYNSLDLSDNADSVLSTTDLNCVLNKQIPPLKHQLSDESSNSSFPDLPPKVISGKASKNSPAQRDGAKTTPTKHQVKKSEKGDRKRRRQNSSTTSAANTNTTTGSDALSPQHTFVEPPTKQMKRETGKSPANNSPANNSNTTPTRAAIIMNNDLMSSPANAAVTAAIDLPQAPTSPMDTTQQYNTISNEYKPKDYMGELQELHNKIMTLQDNEELQRVVELIATTGCYEITSKTFDFDLCKLDRNTVQRLQEHFAASAVS